YFFELLENYNNREYVYVQNPTITIEHIFPQTPTETWYNRLDEGSISLFKDKYLNTIANLTLSGNNGALSNRYFLEKKTMNIDGGEQGYAFSRLWLNKYLREINEWNIETLKERFGQHLSRFYNIWEFPEVTLDDEIDTDQDYYIYNAPDPKFKKLDYFIFRDEKIVTEEVSKMYYHVISKLFEETPSAFYHKNIKELLGLTTNKNELRSPFQINASTFIESNIDSASKFRRLRILLNKLDYEEDLLINFSDLEPDEMDDESADRNYWANRSEPMLSLVDKLMQYLNTIDPQLALNYNARYIGISKQGKVQNFIIFAPKQNFIWCSAKVQNPENWKQELINNSYKYLSTGSRYKRIKFRITQNNLEQNRNTIEKLLYNAYNEWMN
ncbi:MAG: HNH endonuclease family protein, partial [Saprospiraceae bacterium]